ncbi:DUF6003 family protein [Streptomyces coeruleorubidus]|uniref:Uncharacterized protein n=1 Tax=Streptomyces coeruleorubidus TaxID=116188 RepID=A0A5J6HWF5_STRC4|nr:DUF6003 family protein [Streptomyces coeruleorubidus]QEV22793.1 hypothetical protein CP976_00295 [Streptomyces coeruleorubidus]GGU03063.1 hypothetical protein GCM10010256_73930 [Streptomyces coeruleorubidus]
MSSRRRTAALLGFRDATEDWEVLVQRAATTGIPAPRIVQLTGLDPLDVTRALAENPWHLSVLSMQSPPGTRRMCPPLAAAVTRSQRSSHSRRWAGEALLRRFLSQLPPGHADVFAVRIRVHRRVRAVSLRG